MLFVWNVAPFIAVTNLYTTGSVLGSTSLNIHETSIVIQAFKHDKSNSVSQLIKSKLRDLQKLLKYFNETATSAFNLLVLTGVFPVIFVLYLKDLLVVVLFLFIILSSLSVSSVESFTSSL